MKRKIWTRRELGVSPLPIVDPYRERLEVELECLKLNILAKYDKGRIDHGYDDLSKLDYDKEIMDELMDLIVYSLLKKTVGDRNAV